MVSAPDQFIFFQIPSTSANKAFLFFESIQLSDDHLWPRTREEIYHFAVEGELFGIRASTTEEFVGLCYASLNKEETEYEIGGLIVADIAKNLGLGTILTRFAVAHVIANERPWLYKRKIISHIHQANNDPRNIFARSWFEQIGSEPVPEEIAPPSMKRNAEGKLVGDKFEFPRTAVPQLSKWLNEEFNGLLRDGKALINIELLPAGVKGLKQALLQEILDMK
jgi:hypothetical protein